MGVISFLIIELFICLGIIPSRYVAGVMNDGKFSASLITEQTQIVIMDEWTPDSLSCEDAKRVLQGITNILFFCSFSVYILLSVHELLILPSNDLSFKRWLDICPAKTQERHTGEIQLGVLHCDECLP